MIVHRVDLKAAFGSLRNYGQPTKRDNPAAPVFSSLKVSSF